MRLCGPLTHPWLEANATRRWHIGCLNNRLSSKMIDNPKKILLVDREPGVTRLIKRALEKTGKYWVKEEHDSQFALHSAKAFQPDLILLDTVSDGSDREQLDKKIHTDSTLH